MDQDPGRYLLARLDLEPRLLEGSALYFAVLAADGTAQAAGQVPAEAFRFREVPGQAGQLVLQARVEVVLEVAVPEALAAEAAEAVAGSFRFWDRRRSRPGTG